MIRRIDLRHFKWFETLKLPVGPLTLLSGANASGKSSVMQALVLLHQTMREDERASRLMLNGAAMRLGAAGEVIDEAHGRGGFGITLFDGDFDRFEWEFRGERDETSMAVGRVQGETRAGGGWDADGSRPLRWLLPTPWSDHSLTDRLRRLTYLTAGRLGPLEPCLVDDSQHAPVVGPRGESAVRLLHSGRDAPVLPALVDESVPPTLFRQVEVRMAGFFPGCVLGVEQVPSDSRVTLGLRVSSCTDFHRPVHAGFGLSQVLPIVVAALSARQDDILLIENPEVHLHPASQAEMGGFLARVASADVQVMIETHSDHLLNGVRRAVKDGLLSSEAVALYFFRPRRGQGADGVPQVQSPIIDEDGKVDSWPVGFFDQFDHDMNHFAGWG